MLLLRMLDFYLNFLMDYKWEVLIENGKVNMVYILLRDDICIRVLRVCVCRIFI